MITEPASKYFRRPVGSTRTADQAGFGYIHIRGQEPKRAWNTIYIELLPACEPFLTLYEKKAFDVLDFCSEGFDWSVEPMWRCSCVDARTKAFLVVDGPYLEEDDQQIGSFEWMLDLASVIMERIDKFNLSAEASVYLSIYDAKVRMIDIINKMMAAIK